MSSLLHTYGPTCLLYDPEDNPTTKSDFSTSTAPPKVRAQFFYLSSFPIDDPLTPLPAASASSSSSQSSFPPRPFSVLDNIALEEAWHGLRNAVEDQDADDTRKSGSEEDRANRAWRQKVDRLILEALTAVREYRDASPDLNVTPINERHDTSSIFALVEKHAAIYGSSEGGETEKRRFVVSTLRNVIEQISRQKESAWRHDLRPIIVALFCAAANEIPNQEKDTSTKVADKFSRQVCEQEEPAGVPIPIRMPAESAGDVEASSNSMGQILDPYNSPKSLKRHSPPADRKSKTSKRISISSPCGDDVFGSYSSQTGRPIPSAGVHGGDTNITGSPFIRAPARSPRSVPSPRSPATPSRASHPLGGMVTVDQGSDVRSAKSRVHSAGSPSKFTVQRLSPSELEVTPVQRKKEPDAVIPVGISRLHSVELPNLEVRDFLSHFFPRLEISNKICR